MIRIKADKALSKFIVIRKKMMIYGFIILLIRRCLLLCSLDVLSCRRFDANQYGSIVKSYMIFDYMRDR